MSEGNITTKVIYGFAVVCPSIVSIVAGGVVSMTAPLYRHHYTVLLGGKPLPALTESALKASEFLSPLVSSLIFGVVIAIASSVLILTAPNQHSAIQRLLCWATIVWVCLFSVFATILLSFALPFVSLDYGMQAG